MAGHRRPIPALLAGAALLAACASPTPYQPATNGHGYREQPLAENRYRVVVTGNRLTERARVEDYLLFRAAELTREHGGTHFTMVARDVEREETYWASPGQPFFHGHGSRRAVGLGFGVGISPTTVRARKEYRASAEILIRADGAAPDGPETYNAAEVIDRLQDRIQPANGT